MPLAATATDGMGNRSPAGAREYKMAVEKGLALWRREGVDYEGDPAAGNPPVASPHIKTSISLTPPFQRQEGFVR